LLSRVNVISAVSGGSVIAGIYAYASQDFSEFERRTVEFLKKGLVRCSLYSYVFTGYFILELLNWLTIVLASALEMVLQRAVGRAPAFLRVRRVFSRTKIVIAVLDRVLFRGRTLERVRRPNLQVVFNATELGTCTAFRFGSNEVS